MNYLPLFLFYPFTTRWLVVMFFFYIYIESEKSPIFLFKVTPRVTQDSSGDKRGHKLLSISICNGVVWKHACLETPYNLKTYGFRAFSVIAPLLWNDLPIDIRSIDDVNKFKSKLKTFLASLRTILGVLLCILVTMYIYNICNDFRIFISYSDLFEAL